MKEYYKITDTVRDRHVRLIYLEDEGDYNITLSPVPLNGDKYDDKSRKLALFKATQQTTTNSYLPSGSSLLNDPVDLTSTSRVGTYSFTISDPNRYYILVVF